MEENHYTVINIPPVRSMLCSDKFVLTGSCFSQHIGKKLASCGMKILENPHGILFNPLSIALSLGNALSGRRYGEEICLRRDGLFFSYMHHTSIYNVDKEKLIVRINEDNMHLQEDLTVADYLIITWGSAHYYRLNTSGNIVANCHKQPSETFEKKMATVAEIVEMYEQLFVSLFDKNPGIKIVMTVSPVRYLKDGFIENQISKANLILAVHHLCQKFTNRVMYFPSYEIFMDELRDYRFYDRDMVHPNELGIDYVWERFRRTYFDKEQQGIIEEAENINRMKNHRILFPEAESTGKFMESREAAIGRFCEKYPYLNI